MQRIILALLLCFTGYSVSAAVGITTASGGTNICSNVATSPTTLGNIVITEGLATDFPSGSSSIVLSPPAGWSFVAVLPTITASGGDVSIGVTSITAGSLTINFNASGTTHIDVVTIANLQVVAATVGSGAGNITSAASTVVGAGGQNYGALSILTAVTPGVSIAAAPSSTICSGTNVTFTPTPTNGGVTPSYQWQLNGVNVFTGSSYSNAALNNGDQVKSIMTSSLGCVTSGTGTSNTVVMTVNALPTAFSVTGGGAICAGSSVAVGLSGSGSGISYQLYKGGVATGSAVSGTGSAITFGPQSVAGVYTVIATNSVSGCTNNMTGSVTITVNSVPVAYSVTGGGSYCAGGSGVVVGLSSSASGVNYQLYIGGIATGTLVGGTGGSITFGPQTTAGTYTVIGSDAVSGCSSNMTGSATVSINALPTVFAMTGGGGYCIGSSGVAIGLAGSVSGVNYQLYLGGVATGSPVSGSGAAITFGTITTAGTYSAGATTVATGCTNNMSGLETVFTNPIPGAFNVTGGGTLCAGGSGVAVGLSGSAVGVNYQLYVGGVATGSSVSGTGSAITFGPQTTGGTYTVVATIVATGCTNNMTGTATVTVNAAPTSFAVTGTGSYCAGGSGVAVGLAGSSVGISYQLYLGGVATGTAVSGTGSSFTFASETTGGTYTVIATNSSTGCTAAMSGSAVVTVNAVPGTFAVTGGGSYCAGGTGVNVGISGSAAGINYQLYKGGVIFGGSVSGTGSSFNFALETNAGVYTIVATNAVTGCTSNMTGSATVAINALPTAYTMTGGGSYCAGGLGVDVGLNGSDVGFSYQLWRGGVAVGSAMAGIGSALDFGNQTVAGTYTIISTNTTTSCTNAMNGSDVVTINAAPTAFAVTGGGAYCVGGTGVVVGLANSVAGVNYQLYVGGVATGVAVSGIGAAITFGLQTVLGTYTVVATTVATGCTSNMTGSVTITNNPLPVAFTVTGGGSYCAGGSGVTIGLSNSVAGVNYQLWLGGVPVGSSVSGIGSAITFGSQTTAGVYTVLATTVATGCTNFMTGSATVTVNALPTAYAVTGGGSYCAGGTGVVVGLANSTSGVNYQLYLGGVATGSPVPGNGLPLSFASETSAGVYTVIATNAATLCTANMTGSATVTINALPVSQTVTGGGSYCAGGAGVAIGLASSVVGVNYQLYRGATALNVVSGTGGVITFGSQTVAGTYTVLATTVATGCTNNMTGSATISINPVPNVYTISVSGGGAYCAGGLGADITLSNADLGINYTLYRGGVALFTLGGLGAMLDFGYETTAGAYTIVATNPGTGCTSNMTGTANISINPLPVAYAMTGGGNYCAGGTGVVVGLANSAPGVTYQLYVGGVATGLPVSGAGIPISFGLQTTGGTYTVIATLTATGCTNTMTGTETVTVNPLPTAFNVTGTGSYCAGGSGLTVGLNGSVSGVNYQLYKGGVISGAAVPGTGLAITFGLETTAATYTVVATTVATGCTNNMTGSAVITINPLPGLFNVTGTGSYCAGGSGLHVGLSGSAIGINYQLYIGGVLTGPVVAGNGLALDFGLQTAAGTYTVIATNATTGCTSNMTGSAVISINPAPTAFTVTGGGGYCTGGTGVVVGLSGSQAGVSYQLYNTFVATGMPDLGSGAAITFGLQTATGYYTVVATNSVTGCTSNMTAGVAITLFPLPTVYTVVGGGGYCAGGTGVDVALNSSDVGVTYQLFRGGSPIGAPMSGLGSVLDFGLQTVAGVYTIVATNTSTGCNATMAGSATVIVNVLPTAYSVTGGGVQCAGGIGLAVGLSSSTSGVNYKLYLGGIATGLPVSGSGAAITFGLQTSAGNYTVVATNATTGCTNNMTGSVNITLNPLPTAYTMTGGGGYCAGGTGVLVGLANSDNGINYQLFRGGVGLAVMGGTTGSALSFGLQTIAGVYTIVATNTTTGCTDNMTGSETVVVNPLPIAYAVTGGGPYCAGGMGSDVGTANSDFGINYQLYVGGVATGSPLAGNGLALDFGFQTTGGIYTVVATSSAGCTNAMTGSVTIIVNPVPAPITGVTSVCDGFSTTLGDLTAGGAWSSSDATIGNVAGGVVSGVNAGSCTISYTLPVTGCYAVTPYTVYALPIIYNVTGGGSYCSGGSGLSVTLSGSETGVNYQVYLGGVAIGALVAGTGTPLNFLFTTAGVYTISATNGTSGCNSNMTGSATIVVNPLPAAITGASNVCIGYSTTLSDITGTGVWSSTNPATGSVDGTGDVMGVSPGTTVISYTLPITGCGVAFDFTVNAVPVVAPITGPTNVCESAVADLADVTSGGGWTSSDATIAAIDPLLGIVTGVSTGVVTITYTVSTGAGCTTYVTALDTVNASPIVAAISGAMNVCMGLTTDLSDATSGGAWTSGNTSIATVGSTGIVTGIGSGVVSLSYSVTSGGCTTVVTYPFTVGNTMPSSFDLPVSSATLCHGNPVLLSVVSSGSLAGYQWNLGGFPIPGATDSTYTSNTAGMYSVTISNGTCTETLSTITVDNPPAPVIAVDTAGGYLYTGSFSTYQWYYNGIPLTGATTNITTEASSGSYYVVVSDANGCYDTSAIFITPASLGAPNSVKISNINIYPNPATSILNIEAPFKVLVSITSPEGQLVMDRKEAVSVNISGLADGVYMIMVYDESNNLVKSEKFIKMQ